MLWQTKPLYKRRAPCCTVSAAAQSLSKHIGLAYVPFTSLEELVPEDHPAKPKIAAAAYPTSVIPPKGTRRQSRRRERAKPDVGIRSPWDCL